MIDRLDNPGNGIGAIGGTTVSGPNDTRQSISGTFEKLITEATKNLEAADNAIVESSTGGQVDLHEVMIAMEKADISLRMLVQVRNKAIDAYQEIMRMQV